MFCSLSQQLIAIFFIKKDQPYRPSPVLYCSCDQKNQGQSFSSYNITVGDTSDDWHQPTSSKVLERQIWL